MKKPIFSLGYILLFLIALHTITVPAAAHNADPAAEHFAYYNVTATNASAEYSWSNADYTEFTPYNVQLNDLINVTLFDPTEVNTEMNITIGNLTTPGFAVHHVTDSLAAQNLGIGYWKLANGFGFVSSTNWTEIDTAMKTFNFTEYSFVPSFQFQFGAAAFEAVNFTFSDGFQSTSLVYDIASGLLYHAQVVIQNFVLSFDITGYAAAEEDHVDNTSSSSVTTPIDFIVPFLISFGMFTYYRRRLD